MWLVYTVGINKKVVLTTILWVISLQEYFSPRWFSWDSQEPLVAINCWHYDTSVVLDGNSLTGEFSFCERQPTV